MNLGILFLGILFLISQNIFLLNEESLILFSFFIFCWLTFNKVKESINLDFNTKKKEILNPVKNSFFTVIEITNKFINLQSFTKTIKFQIQNLKEYLLVKNSLLIEKSCKYSFNRTKFIFFKKLVFLKRLEQQSNKLLILLLLKKLETISSLKNFYGTTIKLSNFQEINKIIFREYLEILSNSKRI